MAVQTVKRAQKRILGDVIRVMPSYDPRRHAEDDAAMTLHQLLERAHVSRQGLLD